MSPLKAFCAAYGPGFWLEYDDNPAARPDAIGMPGATKNAQLCQDNIIALKPGLEFYRGYADVLRAERERLSRWTVTFHPVACEVASDG